VWQLLYLWKTEVLDHAVLANDRDQQTSIRWLASSNGFMANATLRFCRRFGIMALCVSGLDLAVGQFSSFGFINPWLLPAMNHLTPRRAKQRSSSLSCSFCTLC
jgi:hypothetical protein